jgi:hypothetical protein
MGRHTSTQNAQTMQVPQTKRQLLSEFCNIPNWQSPSMSAQVFFQITAAWIAQQESAMFDASIFDE